MKTHKRSTFAQNPRRENPLSLRHLFVKIPKMLSGEIIHNIALQHKKKVFKFTSTIYWKKCLDILIIEKGLHGDWNGNPCFPTTALFDGRSYWRDAKWSLTFPETSRWWLSCHSWQGRGEARPKRFRHPTSRQETLHYPRQSGGIATQKSFFFQTLDLKSKRDTFARYANWCSYYMSHIYAWFRLHSLCAGVENKWWNFQLMSVLLPNGCLKVIRRKEYAYCTNAR